ncbi:MAG: M14 family metallopeptidase [Cyclobacteriaceae bacterium]
MIIQRILSVIVTSLLLLHTTVVLGQSNYPSNVELRQRLEALAGKSSEASLQSLTKTTAGNDVWALTLARGNTDEKPAVAVVGGVAGNHLLGVELALRFAEDVLANNKDILDHTTFYIFPNMSPDATAQYFARLKYDRTANARPTDDDRDGETNEDPFEDLDGNGVITMIRVEDATGDYISHPADERVMIKADRSKGEKGRYKIYTEGIDNDGDYKWNEDGPGGISFNKNMSYRFPYFESGAGEHAVSEVENRALLDFMYTKWNIYAIVSFGPQNNLSAPLKYNKAGTSKRVITSILKEDASVNSLLSEKYNEITSFSDGKPDTGSGGDFFQWAYFHFGKLSLSTPGWWVPMMKIDKDDSVTVPNKDKNAEVNFLRWAEQEALSNYFTEWKKIDHPDFVGKTVEVGGIHPYVMTNPPYKSVNDISQKNNRFLYELAAMQQAVKIVNVTTKPAGNQLTRITAEIYNDGVLPTHTAMGDKSRWLRKVKVSLITDGDQQILSGKKITLIDKIEGDQSVKYSWLIKGKGSITIEAGAPHTGTDQINVALNK